MEQSSDGASARTTPPPSISAPLTTPPPPPPATGTDPASEFVSNLDEEKPSREVGCLGRVCQFLGGGSTLAMVFWLTLCGLFIFALPALLLWRYAPQVSPHRELLPPLCLLLGAIGGSLFALALIYLCLWGLLRGLIRVAPGSWDALHYAAELEGYLGFMLWLLGGLLACWLIPPETQLMKGHNALLAQFLAALLLGCALLAAKRHAMLQLALRFNSSNYHERMEEALFADHLLTLLWRSRHTYKFRKRWTTAANVQQSSPSSLVVSGGSWHAGQAVANLGTMTARLLTGRRRSVEPAAGGEEGGVSRVTFESPPCSPSVPPSSPVDICSSPLTAAPAEPPHHHVDDGHHQTRRAQLLAFGRLANRTMSRMAAEGVGGGQGEMRLAVAREARRQASKLFKYLKPNNRDTIGLDDLLAYVEDAGEGRRAQALLQKYGGAQLGYWREGQLRRALDGILWELVMLCQSMQTMEAALGKLDWLIGLVVGLLMAIGVAIVAGRAVQLLLALATALSAAAFAFGSSAKNMFESIVFLLIIHPFDVGDRVLIPLGITSPTSICSPAIMPDGQDNLVVVEMHLLSTCFERWDGVKVYVPNYVLAQKPIFNLRRAGPLSELTRLHVNHSTPASTLDQLRSRLDAFVRANPADYTEISRVVIDSLENCNRMTLLVIFQHASNWQDLDRQLTRRSKFLTFLRQTVEDLEIGWMPPIQRIALVDPRQAVGEKESPAYLSAADCRQLLP